MIMTTVSPFVSPNLLYLTRYFVLDTIKLIRDMVSDVVPWDSRLLFYSITVHFHFYFIYLDTEWGKHG